MNPELKYYLALREKTRAIQYHVAERNGVDLKTAESFEHDRLLTYVEEILENYEEFIEENEADENFHKLAAREYGADLAPLLYQWSEAQLDLVAWQTRSERHQEEDA